MRDFIELADERDDGLDWTTVRFSSRSMVDKTWFVTGRLDTPVNAVTEAAPGRIFAATGTTVYEFNQNSVRLAYSPVSTLEKNLHPLR